MFFISNLLYLCTGNLFLLNMTLTKNDVKTHSIVDDKEKVNSPS